MIEIFKEFIESLSKEQLEKLKEIINSYSRKYQSLL